MPRDRREYMRAYHAEYRLSEKRRAYMRAYREKHRERHRAFQAEYRLLNRDRRNEYYASYNKDNAEKRKKYRSTWLAKNMWKIVAYASKRKAEKLRATPVWANHFFIEEIYDLAQRRTKATGFKWHVDHIVPLISKKVCGLHVENNLQVIPARENLSKGNRVWPFMP